MITFNPACDSALLSADAKWGNLSVLFRPEALESRRNRLEGDVMLTRSVSLWVITLLLSAVTLALALWAILGHYSRTEIVPGAITSDRALSKIFADRPGRVVWLGVKDGEVVREGQPIVTIRVEQALAGGRSPNGERLNLVQEQRHLAAGELVDENIRTATERQRLNLLISQLNEERGELTSQLDIQKSAIASTRSSFEALAPLVQNGFETKTNYEGRRQAWLNSASQYQGLVQQLSQIDQRHSQAEAELARVPEEHADKIASIQSSLSDIDQRQIEIVTAIGFTIVAPVTGRVTNLQTSVGRNTDTRQPMFAIVSQGARLRATLFAPSRSIGMARRGQSVRLMYDAFPYQRVRKLSRPHSIRLPQRAYS